MSQPSRAVRTLEVVRRVVEVLQQHEIEAITVGAMALAAHSYVRETEDFDLGTAVDPFVALKRATQALSAQGFDVEFILPDADDPLGGVATIRGSDFDDVQVVNFLNPWTGGAASILRDAIEHADEGPGVQGLKVAPLAHIIALKLYAGGPKSLLDVTELLRCNPDVDRTWIRSVCERLRLGTTLDRIIEAMDAR